MAALAIVAGCVGALWSLVDAAAAGDAVGHAVAHTTLVVAVASAAVACCLYDAG